MMSSQVDLTPVEFMDIAYRVLRDHPSDNNDRLVAREIAVALSAALIDKRLRAL